MKRNRPEPNPTLAATGPIIDAAIRFYRDFPLIAVGTDKRNVAISNAFLTMALSAMGYDLSPAPGPGTPGALSIEH